MSGRRLEVFDSSSLLLALIVLGSNGSSIRPSRQWRRDPVCCCCALFRGGWTEPGIVVGFPQFDGLGRTRVRPTVNMTGRAEATWLRRRCSGRPEDNLRHSEGHERAL